MTNITRRAMLAGTAAVAALATTRPIWAQDGRGSDTMTHLIPSEPPTFDLHATQTSFCPQTIGPCYSTLMKFDTENYPEIVGDLAESWEVSDDYLTYTFTLHDGITFHDGSPCTAEDVKTSYDRIMSPPEGIVSVRMSELDDIASVEVVDERTIRFTLAEVNVAMMNNFASPWHVVYSAAKLAENPNYPATEVMGTGPFKLDEHAPGSHVELSRYDGYFHADQPHLAKIRGTFTGGPALTTALTAGQADGMFHFVTPQQRDSIAQVQGDKMIFDEAVMNSLVFATFNTQKAPFDDQRVRQALNLAIDRYLADEALQNISVMRFATAYFAPNSPYTATGDALEALPGYGTDIEAARDEARALLEEAGHSKLKVKFVMRNLPPFETPTVFMIDQWRQIGVETEVVKLDTPQYFAALESGDFDFALEAYNFNTMDPNDVFQKFLPEGTLNYAGNEDAELSELFKAMKVETDTEARKEMAARYQTRLAEQAYYAPLLWNRRITVQRADLTGWNTTPVMALGYQFANMRFVA